MNDREILAATLRWHTAHARRLEIGAEQRRYQSEQKQRTGFGGSDFEISQRLTAAKRPELAALRQLAKVSTGEGMREGARESATGFRRQCD